MQAFEPQLNDFDIAAVITYERNAWGNNGDNMVKMQVVWCNLQMLKPDGNAVMSSKVEIHSAKQRKVGFQLARIQGNM